MPATSCQDCGTPLPPPRQGRPRVRCEPCTVAHRRKPRGKNRPKAEREAVPTKPARARRGPKVVELPSRPAADVTEPEDPPSVYAATLARLTAADLVDDPEAVVVLVLAAKLDAGQESGASMAALARQHASGMSAVLGRATVADDPLDELAARRDAKLGPA